MNDVLLNRKKIYKYLGEYEKVHRDRAYTTEEIAKLLQFCDQRLKAIVLFLVSSGSRLGSLTDLKARNLVSIPKYNLYRVTIYENSREEYYTFTTPEARRARRAGEGARRPTSRSQPAMQVDGASFDCALRARSATLSSGLQSPRMSRPPHRHRIGNLTRCSAIRLTRMRKIFYGIYGCQEKFTSSLRSDAQHRVSKDAPPRLQPCPVLFVPSQAERAWRSRCRARACRHRQSAR